MQIILPTIDNKFLLRLEIPHDFLLTRIIASTSSADIYLYFPICQLQSHTKYNWRKLFLKHLLFDSIVIYVRNMTSFLSRWRL